MNGAVSTWISRVAGTLANSKPAWVNGRVNIRNHTANVLVIGSGAAGLRAAIAAHEAGAEVIVVGKRPRLDAHTVLASGGINAALGTRDPEDSWQQHFADTLVEGYLLGDPRVVEVAVREAPAAVEELADWGCAFARTDDGRLDQRFFGAHRWRRTCYAGDYSGRAILHTLAARVAALGIAVIDEHYVSRLLVADGGCFGAFAFDLHDGSRTAFLADAVVLCGGGHTRIWRRSSSRRDENFGEAMALALRAGTRLMDMELVQFHPTGMVAPEEAAGVLVTEAVRGEGGRLYNVDGERFMTRYDPDRMELSTTTGSRWQLARPLQRALRDLMWERCGVTRDEHGLRDGIARLDDIRGAVADVDVRPSAEGWSDLAQLIDLRAGPHRSPRPPYGVLSCDESREAATTGPTSRISIRASTSTSTPASVTTDNRSSRGARPSSPYPTSS